ncbi:hypothetical protein ABTK84_19395, partial [Acinetobacter baumannii]
VGKTVLQVKAKASESSTLGRLGKLEKVVSGRRLLSGDVDHPNAMRHGRKLPRNEASNHLVRD